eukprot:IDg4242t1
MTKSSLRLIKSAVAFCKRKSEKAFALNLNPITDHQLSFKQFLTLVRQIRSYVLIVGEQITRSRTAGKSMDGTLNCFNLNLTSPIIHVDRYSAYIVAHSKARESLVNHSSNFTAAFFMLT